MSGVSSQAASVTFTNTAAALYLSSSRKGMAGNGPPMNTGMQPAISASDNLQ